jgi:hypothetical protein
MTYEKAGYILEPSVHRNEEGSWVFTLDKERKMGLIFDDRQVAMARLSEAKQRIAEGWQFKQFIEEWF